MVSRSGADRFETRLERLFAEAPVFADAEDFAHRVQGQMDRGQGWRTMLVGAMAFNCIGSLASALAPGFATLMAARIVLGAAVGSYIPAGVSTSTVSRYL